MIEDIRFESIYNCELSNNQQTFETEEIVERTNPLSKFSINRRSNYTNMIYRNLNEGNLNKLPYVVLPECNIKICWHNCNNIFHRHRNSIWNVSKYYPWMYFRNRHMNLVPRYLRPKFSINPLSYTSNLTCSNFTTLFKDWEDSKIWNYEYLN